MSTSPSSIGDFPQLQDKPGTILSLPRLIQKRNLILSLKPSPDPRTEPSRPSRPSRPPWSFRGPRTNKIDLAYTKKRANKLLKQAEELFAELKKRDEIKRLLKENLCVLEERINQSIRIESTKQEISDLEKEMQINNQVKHCMEFVLEDFLDEESSFNFIMNFIRGGIFYDFNKHLQAVIDMKFDKYTTRFVPNMPQPLKIYFCDQKNINELKENFHKKVLDHLFPNMEIETNAQVSKDMLIGNLGAL